MKIIAHRGARKIVTENTLAALKVAAESSVDAIELDVRRTSDDHLVVCHNENLKSVFGLDKNIGDMSLREINEVSSVRGETLPQLEEVFKQNLGKPLILDLKAHGIIELLDKAIKKADAKKSWSAGSLFQDDLIKLKSLYPNLETALQSYKHPFGVVKSARRIEASAIVIPLYLLNPLNYWLAHRAGLEVRVYQNYLSFLLDSRLFVRLLAFLYPNLTIYTNRPDKIAPLFKT